VSRLNRDAASGAVRVHDCTYQVLEAALDLHRRCGGAFDISVAPALQRLGLLPGVPALSSPPATRVSKSRVIAREGAREEFGLSTGRSLLLLPPRGEKAGMRGACRESEHCGPPPSPRRDPIQLLPKNRIRFADHSVKIDLGGIAKGFAVDRAVEALRRHGVAEGLVNAGGDLRVFGPRSHVVDIRDPRRPERPICRVTLCNAALASSAGRFDPVRSRHALFSGVIDPATATPVRSISGATVCTPDCMLADALTKVVMNAGEAAAPILEHYGAAALFVCAHGDVDVTANWKNEVHLAA